MNPDGSDQRPLLAEPADHASPTVCPLGGSVAFSSTRSGVSAIFTIRTDGTALAQLTNDTVPLYEPAWSPDCTKIVYSRRPGFAAPAGLYVINANGGNPTPLPSDAGDREPSWAPFGTRIVFEGATLHIEAMDTNGATRVVLAAGPGSVGDPAWSPSGQRIAFGAVPPAGQAIYLMNPDGSDTLNLTADTPSGNIQPAWSPSGDFLVYTGFRNGNDEIIRRAVTGGPEVLLTSSPAADSHPSWGPGH